MTEPVPGFDLQGIETTARSQEPVVARAGLTMLDAAMETPAAKPGPRIAPASVGQVSLWFLRQVMPYASAYSGGVQIRLAGDVDAGTLVACVREIVRRHESCRTTFVTVDGAVHQAIWPEMPADVAIIDVASSPDPEAEARRLAREAAVEPFDLERGPLLRVRILRLGDHDHALVLVKDHIVIDGMSLGIWWREIAALYPALREGRPSPLPPPARQFVECVEVQSNWMGTPAFARRLEGWARHIAGAAPCDLPTDRPRPPVKSYRGGFVRSRLPSALVERLRALAERERVTLFVVLLATLDVLLAHYSGQSDVSTLIPFAARQRYRADEVMGYLANVVVLRTNVAADVPFRALLKQVSDEVMGGLFHEDVPFERVIEKVRPDRSLSHDPLASVSFSFLPASSAILDLPGVEATFEEIPNGGSTFDLQFYMIEVAGDLTCCLEYNGDVFDEATIERALGHYRVLLEAVVAHPATTVAELPLLTPAERHRVLVEWNATASEFPRDASIPSLVEATALRAPDTIAASFEGRTLTYAELSRRSNQVARCLRARGVGPGVLVGMAVERSFDMLVGLLGILKAGGAYVPLDPAYPRDRLALMAEDSGLRVLLTEDRLADIVPSPSLLRMDTDRGEIAARSDAPIEGALDPESIAYVVYTSGSTGRPKGVEVPHRAVVNFLTSMAECPGISPRDRLLAVTSLSFDIAGLELWLPLMVGAEVTIASRETASNGAALRALLDSGSITLFQATPSTYRLLLEAGWKGAPGMKVLVGGEATPRDLADQLVERAGSVWNMYGPTETTIWSCVQRLEKNAPVLIGRPIANTQVYVLDHHLGPVPAGVTGEIYIGGEGVARGYLGRPKLTGERFVPDPFSQRPGARMYRTGDLERFRADGALDYLGRNDFQVKVRGYRIELGEIEATLATHPAIREAVVAAYEETPGDQRLVAYVTSDSPPAFDDLRAHLRAKLPEYMVPASFVALDRLPLTANNKIDRKALPRPGPVAVDTSRARTMPREAVEFKLRAIWEEVLRVTGIGVDDSFFDVGGHSLLALKLFQRIEAAFGIRLPLTALFQAPTIVGLADLLRREGWQPSWSSLVPIQPAGSRPPLFFVHAIGGNILNYRLISKYLSDDQPFFGLQARGLSGKEAPHETVEEMAADYLREVREQRPHGPYQLGGASSGGVVAYEMAQQLLALGEQVSAILMLDTFRPGPLYAGAEGVRSLRDVAMRLDHHFGNLLLRSPRQGLEYLTERVRAHRRGADDQIARARSGQNPALPHVIECNRRALARYVARPYPGGAVMLLSRAEPERAFCDGRLAWADLLAEGLTVRFIPGSHENMLDESNVAGVAAVLSRCLGSPAISR